MTRGVEEPALIIIHRDLPGEHFTDGRPCWCNPVIEFADSFKTTEQMVEESRVFRQ